MSAAAKPRMTTAIRFSPELHQRLHAASDEHDLPINWLVNRAVAEFLDRLLPADQIVWTRGPVGTPGDAQ